MNLDICKKCEKRDNCVIFARTHDGLKYAYVMHHKSPRDIENKSDIWWKGIWFGVILGKSDFFVSQEAGTLMWHVGYVKYNGLPTTGTSDEHEWHKLSEKDWGLDEYAPDEKSQDACPYWTEQTVYALNFCNKGTGNEQGNL